MDARLRLALLGAGAVLLGMLLTAAPAMAADPGARHRAPTPAVAYQLNPAHTGATADVMSARPTRRWAVTFGGAVSYPLIVSGRVYVTVADSDSYGTALYAFNAVTGAKDWGPIELGGVYNWSALAYDRGRVFTVNTDGMMRAFSAPTGVQAWATQLPGQYLFTSPPTARRGIVYTGGAGTGGTVYAVDESTGRVTWTEPVENGDDSSPAVSSTGVYVSYACGQTYDFTPATGVSVWHRDTDCEGGGGSTPVLAHGRLYVRDFLFPAVLNASTGDVLGPFAKTGPAPAVDTSTIYNLSNSGLTATRMASGKQLWSFTGDGTLSSAPLVAGRTVFIGATSGNLYALARGTGQVIWSTNVGSAIPSPDEQNVVELSGLATSGGLLMVAADHTLIAYK